jgi:hypothetical protein
MCLFKQSFDWQHRVMIKIIFLWLTLIPCLSWAMLTRTEFHCVEASLKLLDRFQYDDRHEYLEIVASCQFNLGADCLNESIKTLSRFDFDSRNEVVEINNSCKNVDANCLEIAKSYLPSNQKDDRHEIIALNQLCQFADADCLKYYCDLVDRKYCDSYFKIRDIIGYCK